MAGLVRRRRGRLLASAGGVAIAVALLASIGAFLSASKATMTRRAIADVAVDWQVQAQSGADPLVVQEQVAGFAGVEATELVLFGASAGLQTTTAGSVQTTGPGVVLGIAPTYRATFPDAVRDLAGAPSGVLLAQQTAANLHAAPGDTVLVRRTGLEPSAVQVDGVIDLPAADSLFQKVGAPPGAQPQAPPDNVLLVPLDRWHELFDPLGETRPDLLTAQVHTRLTHRLPADPAAAYSEAAGRARNLEVKLAGAGLVGDNLAATLSGARDDALYAQVLFLFLGLPGAVLAGLLTATMAASGADRRRREQSLLRARGASSRQLLRFASLEAGVIAVVGVAAGLVLALVVGRLAFDTVGFGATRLAAAGWAAGAAAAGALIAAATVVLPTRRDLRNQTVAAGRATVGRRGTPRWARAGLDVALLALSGLVFWLTSRNGFKLVVAPEGVPTISVSYWAFAGPALLWTGAGLAAWRLSDLLLRRGRPLVALALRPLAGPLADTVAAGMGRQRRLLAKAVVLVALTASFAASTAIFNATYRQQAEVDARLTNGADVTVTESPGTAVPASFADKLDRVPGVHSVEPLQHRYAYVGADLQDLYGVRTGTVAQATSLQDAYFSGGTADQLIATLAASPDSLLVSLETVSDFQLEAGDPITLRLQDGRTKQLVSVPFRYVGVAKEFPTAPHDSFLVANADYVARMTGSDAVGTFLVDTAGASPPVVAERIKAVTGTSAAVTDILTSRHVIGSSLTSVDLAGLTRVELGFALVLMAAATGLVLFLGLAERRRTFAVAAALGASPRQLAAFVWGESLFVAVGGLFAGAAGGFALTHMLVKVLTGVFDPAPSHLAVPWVYLSVVTAIGAGGVATASAAGVASSRRSSVTVLREL
ncbi:MAG: FtsX-like permease family protein [Acidimicrobiales bacterium]